MADGAAEGIAMRSAVLLVMGLLLVTFIGASTPGSRAQDKAEKPEGKKSPAAEGQPKVVKERIGSDLRRTNEKLLRITGKVKVIDASTLVFEDGTMVEVAGMVDAPALEQKGLIGDSLYSCGKEAAEFLQKLIGDQPVSFYAFGDGGDRDPKKLRGRCFVGETSLGIEMVRNGWALAHHSQMTPYEIIARENKRGLWRGRFIIPERWRKGDRLPGE
jgi:endonuclease YncB( thermonuclease family)